MLLKNEKRKKGENQKCLRKPQKGGYSTQLCTFTKVFKA